MTRMGPTDLSELHVVEAGGLQRPALGRAGVGLARRGGADDHGLLHGRQHLQRDSDGDSDMGDSDMGDSDMSDSDISDSDMGDPDG